MLQADQRTNVLHQSQGQTRRNFCVLCLCPTQFETTGYAFGVFSKLDAEYRKCSANSGKFIYGDWNARVGPQLPGEELVVGEYACGRPAVHVVEVANRDLLLELCTGLELCVSNTFIPGQFADKATFMEVGTTSADPISEHTHNIWDLMVCSLVFLAQLESLT